MCSCVLIRSGLVNRTRRHKVKRASRPPRTLHRRRRRRQDPKSAPSGFFSPPFTPCYHSIVCLVTSALSVRPTVPLSKTARFVNGCRCHLSNANAFAPQISKSDAGIYEVYLRDERGQDKSRFDLTNEGKITHRNSTFRSLNFLM